ncbi:DNA polymerase delta subunit 3-like isoform X2 [Ylistrum balloti]|uniref:DNA polymerase delta subunit 3-like isoform X2 n=1 Tax=Ylistrum balloti TaxID=509963 RepID=UPI0029058636|nr:DNA polymerase delta subunit 3-like isoform X2 [Ylistrum balloti]
MATDALYLENLEEYVNDENKIVTYKWFSTNLKVHVNEAKQMLYAFIQDQRNNHDNDNLSVTYFVAGLTKPLNGHQTHKCTVVKEEDLEAYRSSLAVVTSSHIYSVQKAKLKDPSALYTAEYDSIKESSNFTSIKFPKAKLRSGTEIEALRKTSVSQAVQPKKQTNGTSTTNGQSNPPTKPQQKAGIAGMFAKAAKKVDDTKKEEVKQENVDDKKKEEVKQENGIKENKADKSSSSAKKGGMMAFFSKQTDKKPEQSVKQEPKPTVKKEVQDDPSPPKKKAQPTKVTKKTSRKHDSDDELETKKKRRRIKQDLFDSSSDEEDVEIDIAVPSPVREPVAVLASDSDEEMEITQPKKHSPQKLSPEKRETGERRRKRRRRQVPKTFMDEDGYMVTEKVWESESTDASDVEPAPAVAKETPKLQQKKSPQKSPVKKSPPTGNTKQKTMMSFFKKK